MVKAVGYGGIKLQEIRTNNNNYTFLFRMQSYGFETKYLITNLKLPSQILKAGQKKIDHSRPAGSSSSEKMTILD